MTITIDLNAATGTGTTTFTEQTPVLIFSGATFSAGGTDNNRVDSITITIGSPSATKTLSSTGAPIAGITVGAYNSGTGSLTISGTDMTDGNWQTILRGIQYSDSSDAPTSPGTVTVTASNTIGTNPTNLSVNDTHAESPRILWRLFGLSNSGRIRVG